MARPRADTLPKEPHSVSLKVLRLSRPSLAIQHPLPRETDFGISPLAALAYPSASSDQAFILSSNLSLPPAFGPAYVGETFACSLCANNELASDTTKSISAVRILAEMQTPSQSIPLQLHPSSADNDDSDQISLPGNPLQRIIRFDLKEEGNHVLAVNLSYTESPTTPFATTNAKVRSFRKLYQFQAQPCLSVRTKATELPAVEVPDKSLGPYGRASLSRYALEAQLENVSDGTIVLEGAVLKARSPFRATSLNWDAESDDAAGLGKPILSPSDVLQVAYLVEQQAGVSENLEEMKAGLKRDGRVVLGQLSISWLGNMGENGSLSTGNLLSRRKV